MAKEIDISEADKNVMGALYKSAMSGNVQAQIFWLTNRQPDKWCKMPKAAERSTGECGVVLIPCRRGEEQTVQKG